MGLLTQQTDRFAERFATPIKGANEFFREVSADDPWVEALLCALEPATPTNIAVTPNLYTKRVLRGSDRRQACDTNPAYGATAASDSPAITYVP